MGKSGLTTNQELYCQARMRGLSQRNAYKEAYPKSQKWKESAVDQAASHLEASSKVSARLQGLEQEAAKGCVISRGKLLKRLDGLANIAWAQMSADAQKGSRVNQTASNALIAATRELLPYSMGENEEGSVFVADFGLLLAPAFLSLHRAIERGELDDIWLRGGRGSCKSTFASLEIAYALERDPEANALVMQARSVDIRDGSYAQMMWAFDKLGIDDHWEGAASARRIRNTRTGQLVLFRGCDDPKKTKSIKVSVGEFKYLWLEEADQFKGMAELRTVRQSVTRGADHMLRIHSFNPPRARQSWANVETDRIAASHNPREVVHDSCYTEVPREWLGEQFFNDAEELKEIDFKAYEHEYLGKPVGMGLEVFDPDRIEIREITDEEIASFENPRCGQDFGWYPDPWAFTVSEWQQAGRKLITWYEDGGNKLQPNQQAERIKKALTWADLDGEAEVYHHVPVMSDDADPTAIAAQRDAGINARHAEKGHMRDSSYRFLQASTWVIDPVRCPHLAEEVRNKRYKLTRDGEVLNEVPDGDDHWIDATRYALMPIVKRGRTAYRGE